MISNSGSDENGKYHGGKAGDQTGGEWRIRTWYNRPWNCVLRHPNADVRNLLTEMSTEAANNDMVGYDQWQRNTYWDALVKAHYIPKNITTACEADCSAGVMSNVKGIGYRLGIKELQNVPITTTKYMRSELKKAGFEVLTDKKYLKSDEYLLPGDILLNDKSHTAVNVSRGSKAVNLDKITEFVKRFYGIVLSRTPDKEGLTYWVERIANKKNTPSQVAYGFFFSKELLSQNLSNETYVTKLYLAMLGRQPDAVGFQFWVSTLKNGKDRKSVFEGFANSQEFNTLVASYNIS